MLLVSRFGTSTQTLPAYRSFSTHWPLPAAQFSTQLRNFLAEHHVDYTDSSLVFLLQAAGTSLKHAEAGAPIQAQGFAHAMDTVPEIPLFQTLC